LKQSLSELSLITGFDRRRIRAALCDMPSSKGPKGSVLYETVEALPPLYISPGDADSFDLTSERARLAHHQANKAELEAAQVAGSLIEIQAVADLVGEEYANVRSRLLAISTRAAPQVIGLSIVAVKAMLDDLIFEALDELTADDPPAQVAQRPVPD